MHLIDVQVGADGSFAIVGAHLPITVGLAFASRFLDNDSASACLFGDGTTAIGAEHKNLYTSAGPLSAAEPAGLACASVVQEGSAVTIVASQQMRYRALEPADLLTARGISAEVIDPRTMVPLDLATITASVAKTGRLLCVQECSPAGSSGATLIAAVVAENLEPLDAPPRLVGADETPVPYAGNLEARWLPDAERIAAAAEIAVAY